MINSRMTKNKPARVMFFSVMVTLLAAMGALNGCNIFHRGYTIQRLSDGYIGLTVENESAHFYIEYPSYYDDRDGPSQFSRKGEIPSTSVTLLAQKKRENIVVPDPPKNKVKTVSAEYVPASILVHVFAPRPSLNLHTSEDYIENRLSREARWEHFKLLERSPVTVSGVEGEMIVYVVDWFLPRPQEVKYIKSVYFDYDGLIWNIEGEAEMEMVDQMKADFDYILETFKILGKREPES